MARKSQITLKLNYASHGSGPETTNLAVFTDFLRDFGPSQRSRIRRERSFVLEGGKYPWDTLFQIDASIPQA